MRFGIVAENLLERIGIALGMLPEPMLEGYGAAFARALTVGVRSASSRRSRQNRCRQTP